MDITLAIKSSVYKNDPKRTYTLTNDQREEYRKTSQDSYQVKLNAEKGLIKSVHSVNVPKLNPETLMPKIENNPLSCLSLFSGGGGLDLGFDRAGYAHVASYELIPICKDTLVTNRPNWNVFSGPEDGDVTKVDWSSYRGTVDVIHGGPPCQPFSIAGEQKGLDDERNMWGEFNRAVNTIKPRAFVAENVLGLLSPKFKGFVDKFIIDELSDYKIKIFEMHAAHYGAPQIRRRVFFVGFRDQADFNNFVVPTPTHTFDSSLITNVVEKTMGVREALGLSDIGHDDLAPTIRSAFTGKRNTTSVLNSSAGQKIWGAMQLWPNGVQKTREKASEFPAKNDDFRLSVQDVGLIQGFPESWKFAGAVYQQLGQIGNSVSPPVAYQVAKQVANTLNL